MVGHCIHELCVDMSYHVQVPASLQGDAVANFQSIKDMFD